MNLIESVAELSKANPLLASALGIGGAGVVTYLCKDVPVKVSGFLGKHLTTSLSISNSQICYYQFMQFLEDQKIVNKIRSIKFLNGRWGSNCEVQKSVGNGTHLIWYRKQPLWVTVSVSPSDSFEEKLLVQVTKLGRSHTLFDELQKEFSKPVTREPGKTRVYRWHDFWNCIAEYPSRSMNTVFLDHAKRDRLISTISNFLNNESYYLKRGIPYQLGILLYGIPGSGKTSTIAALAGYFNRDICLIGVGQLPYMQAALGALPQNCFVVIEDIDSNPVVQERDPHPSNADVIVTESPSTNDIGPSPIYKKVVEAKDSSAKEEESYQRMSLSEVLNSLDGLIRCHGRILFMTTNRREVLDSALLRGGRTDLEIEIGHATVETFTEFMRVFFDGDPRLQDMKIYKVKPVCMATLQTEYLAQKPFEYFIETYTMEKA